MSAPPAQETKPQKAAKRAPPDEAGTPAKKRQRTKPPVPRKVESEESELSEPGDSGDAGSDESEKPTKRKLVARAKQTRKVVDSDSDEGSASEASEVEAKPKKAKQPPKKVVPKKVVPKKSPTRQHIVASDTDSPLSEAKDVVGEESDANPAAAADESSESEVIDEPPKRKRKSKEAPAAKGRSKPKGGGAKPAAEISADEAEIKRLQGQLVKCGVRKIWPFELKQYGDDCRAKIRHLKTMLKDIGMDGRFSEARAKEIKERRELLADLEAVTEMDNYWGAGGGRSSRSRAAKPKKPPAKVLSDSDDEDNDKGDGASGSDGAENDDEEDDDEDDGGVAKARARGSAKYRADMAFLGDESESD